MIDLGWGGGYRVEYVDAVTEDPTGDPVPLRGGAFLQVGTTGWQTVRQVAWAGSFEGQTGFGAGVRARLPFRVLELTGPSRVVVDVAHRW